MILYNQTGNQLRWEMAGKEFSCGPHEPIDLPDWLVPHAKRCRLPLDVSPVAAEVKLAGVLQEEKAAIRSDEVRLLKEQLAQAVAAEIAAKDTLSKTEAARSALDDRCQKLEARLTDQMEKTRLAEQDKKAAEELLKELARKYEDAEKSAATSDAVAARTAGDKAKKQTT